MFTNPVLVKLISKYTNVHLRFLVVLSLFTNPVQKLLIQSPFNPGLEVLLRKKLNPQIFFKLLVKVVLVLTILLISTKDLSRISKRLRILVV